MTKWASSVGEISLERSKISIACRDEIFSVYKHSRLPRYFLNI